MPERAIDVIEAGRRCRAGHTAFAFNRDFVFSPEPLQSYAFARWEEVIFDAMVVAAAIEYADRIVKRPPRGWARRLTVRVPVHDPARWNVPKVLATLHDAAGFLTGDFWSISFVKRKSKALAPQQEHLSLSVPTQAVLAYSEGMDSLAVAGLVGAELGDRLVRVRIRKKTSAQRAKGEPFTAVPYDVAGDMSNREATARSRGFKFALIASIAAYLTGAPRIILPESGQGAIGPALITVGHAYPDYRNHPLFVLRMERFIKALLGKQVRFDLPRLWHTKGETLSAYVALTGDDETWRATKSCWRNNQWSSVNGTWRQCGVCAACMLRRVSVHAAGYSEAPETYVCTSMNAATLESAVEPGFNGLNRAYREYAIAGVMHMDHLADMAAPDARPTVRRHATLLGPALGLSAGEANERLAGLLNRHAQEWKAYMKSLGPRSFIRQWSRGAP
jgi:7-cyano-7-deazaguanine synthase in queuosine biosynthesis